MESQPILFLSVNYEFSSLKQQFIYWMEFQGWSERTIETYGDIVVCAISSVYPAKLGKRELPIKSNHPDFKKTGLRIDSVVKINRIATLRKSEIKVY